MTIGQRIAALRKAAGLSQEALAAQLGVSRQAIGKWEADASLPGIDNLQELAKTLGASCDELLTGAPPAQAGAVGPAPAREPVLSLAGAKALLAEEQRAGQKRHIPLYAALIGLVALILASVCVIFYYTGAVRRMQGQVAALSGRVDGLDQRIDQRIGSIESSIRQSLEEQASLVANWNLSYGAYSPGTATAGVRVQATPKTLAEGMTAAFLFTMSDGRAITADASLENGVFTAAASLPLAEGFSLNVSFFQNGISQNQQLTEEHDFKGRYSYRVTPGMLPPPSARYSSLTPDIFYTREACELPLEVELPFLDGELLAQPVRGTLALTLGGEVVEEVDFSFTDNVDAFYPDSTQGFGRAYYTVRLSLEEKTFTLPWKDEYENGGWPEGFYTLTVTDSLGVDAPLLSSLTGWDIPAIPVS